MRSLPFLLLPALALALPAERSAQDSDDDATLTLTVAEQAIRGDLRSQCTLRLVDASALLVNACQTLGLSALLEPTPCEEVCA